MQDAALALESLRDELTVVNGLYESAIQAVDENGKVLKAGKGIHGRCFRCKKQVFSVTGETHAHYFRHHAGESCLPTSDHDLEGCADIRPLIAQSFPGCGSGTIGGFEFDFVGSSLAIKVVDKRRAWNKEQSVAAEHACKDAGLVPLWIVVAPKSEFTQVEGLTYSWLNYRPTTAAYAGLVIIHTGDRSTLVEVRHEKVSHVKRIFSHSLERCIKRAGVEGKYNFDQFVARLDEKAGDCKDAWNCRLKELEDTYQDDLRKVGQSVPSERMFLREQYERHIQRQGEALKLLRSL